MDKNKKKALENKVAKVSEGEQPINDQMERDSASDQSSSQVQDQELVADVNPDKASAGVDEPQVKRKEPQNPNQAAKRTKVPTKSPPVQEYSSEDRESIESDKPGTSEDAEKQVSSSLSASSARPENLIFAFFDPPNKILYYEMWMKQIELVDESFRYGPQLIPLDAERASTIVEWDIWMLSDAPDRPPQRRLEGKPTDGQRNRHFVPFVVQAKDDLLYQAFTKKLQKEQGVTETFHVDVSDEAVPLDEGYSLGCVETASLIDRTAERNVYTLPRAEREEYREHLKYLQEIRP